ncbi:carbohydrate kinase family protein [Stigmatella aurantiaca]|uniref:Acarbose-7-kinase GacK n=1 Tax=Stigmatella aurantiaca (strain DW4/3-1) TaxID=378806 RepID=Q09B66_STIAD|nr:carbohydrate kinase family protein [Stigmatella aurantiaca]ADO69177.1 Acarbose-7-kinase GacK [Stigmatella aurantiaca DW4/3-1]EAU68982.1 ribokinase, putative [Stigmatella aurantiaca DW4/3-1]
MGQRILVAGIVALEMTYRIDAFPLQYDPVRYPFFSLGSSVSGGAYNVARALSTLGDDVRCATLLGRDAAGRLVHHTFAQEGLSPDFALESLADTPHSLILYDRDGRRQIHIDLKDVQDQAYPEERFVQALQGCTLAAVGNANFCRPLLRLAREAGIPIATDVQTVSHLEDPYNQEFMRAADILFMSHERLPMAPAEWVRQVRECYGTGIIVVGMGEDGALLSVLGDPAPLHVPALRGLPVISTVGAGDALFSCFLHAYVQSRDPHQALRKAVAFAAFKIGTAAGASGFLTEEELEQLVQDAMGKRP